MVNKPKAKGTRGESKVVKFMQDAGIRARRIALMGGNDGGDVMITDSLGFKHVLEVKAGKQTQQVSRKVKQEWLRQTRVEAVNSKVSRGFLVIAKHGASTRDYEVWSENGHDFWYLDEFADYMKGV